MHEVIPLAQFAREHGLELRFIEYMPIGADIWERDKVYFAHEILEQIEQGEGDAVAALLDEHLARARELLAGALGGEPGPEAFRPSSALPLNAKSPT